ncbi:NADH dehydrogenase [ubiquinone] 1 alpha subcomplex subunit 13 [Frankliniella fusca]|uniref:NADH dehydrogenase [ubiquinone] 1 alpha subcomplex subunit 13 n=1 Tax=Frankliniella fusca TaxID=407009 RepID=A0AAE1LFK5_9NEOP|nr:NADH dehydrogenase [ubiquinone] 1 alpha subcomplex subunit 13 [Frankliniella fusca]
MSTVTPPQDLPPPGGFGKVQYEKVPHKVVFNGNRLSVAIIASYVVGSVAYYFSCQRMKKIYLEKRSGRIAVQPFLLAERDRQVLKQMRKNRDAEENLMKDVPGWEVGTLYGTPVYNTVGENEWIGYDYDSYYAHTSPADRLEYQDAFLYL